MSPLEIIIIALQIIIIPFIGFLYKEARQVLDKLDDIERKLSNLSTVVIGIDGRNGLRSRVRDLERNVHRNHNHSIERDE